MKHIQKDFEGGKIQAWELNHGITRVVKGGCEYVILADPDRFAAACAEDELEYARLKMKMVAEQEEIPDDIF